MSHTHEIGGVSHSHTDHGHTHEILDGPGSYIGREMPIIEGRDWNERAFTVGIGGYVTFDVVAVPSKRCCSAAACSTHRECP
jgi:hypothetical protein